MRAFIMCVIPMLAGCAETVIAPPTAIDFGDSVSKGYIEHARADIYGVVDLRHDAWDETGLSPKSPTYSKDFINKARNNGYSKTMLDAMEKSLDGQHYNVILYNSGIHDLQHNPAHVDAVRVNPTSYRNNLEAAAQEAESHADIVIWIDTTDVNADNDTVGSQVVDEVNVVWYNNIADTIAKIHGFYILHLPDAQHDGSVHFTSNGYEVLGAAVKDCVITALNQGTTDYCHH